MQDHVRMMTAAENQWSAHCICQRSHQLRSVQRLSSRNL